MFSSMYGPKLTLILVSKDIIIRAKTQVVAALVSTFMEHLLYAVVWLCLSSSPMLPGQNKTDSDLTDWLLELIFNNVTDPCFLTGN